MNNIVNMFIVGFGGFVGAASRYLISGAFQKLSRDHGFPYGTLGVNLFGCLLIGFLGGCSDNVGFFSSKIRLLLFMGVLGGFTTFSTFGYETMALFRDSEITAAFINVGMHVVAGLFFVYLGYMLSALR
ncbi:MAG: fluoride efflux transporter CrcB [Candidatus Omnitrophota bacterium]